MAVVKLILKIFRINEYEMLVLAKYMNRASTGFKD